MGQSGGVSDERCWKSQILRLRVAVRGDTGGRQEGGSSRSVAIFRPKFVCPPQSSILSAKLMKAAKAAADTKKNKTTTTDPSVLRFVCRYWACRFAFCTDDESPEERARCQCWCGCRRQPGEGCRRHCPNCSKMVGPGCCWISDEVGLCHECHRWRVRQHTDTVHLIIASRSSLVPGL